MIVYVQYLKFLKVSNWHVIFYGWDQIIEQISFCFRQNENDKMHLRISCSAHNVINSLQCLKV